MAFVMLPTYAASHLGMDLVAAFVVLLGLAVAVVVGLGILVVFAPFVGNALRDGVGNVADRIANVLGGGWGAYGRDRHAPTSERGPSSARARARRAQRRG
jgi:hypothetical protein